MCLHGTVKLKTFGTTNGLYIALDACKTFWSRSKKTKILKLEGDWAS